MRQHIGNDIRDRAVILLIQSKILQPLGIERGRIVIEGSGAGKDLGVSRPTQALIALRAIRGHVEEISFLPPDDVVMKLVQHLTGSFKSTGGLHGRMDNHAREVIERGFAGPTAHRHITEPLKSEVGLKSLEALAFGGIANGLLRGAKVFGVEIAGAVEHFSVSQRDGGACRRGYMKAHPADHVLPHVNDRIASRSSQNFYWLKFLNFT